MIPDATGNRRLDGLQKIVSNPQVGILFLIPGMREALRVNGQVALSGDPDLVEDLQTGGRPAVLAMIVTVEQTFLHCGKALIRSGLWQPDSWAAAAELPSAAEILNDHVGAGDLTASAASLQQSYTERL